MLMHFVKIFLSGAFATAALLRVAVFGLLGLHIAPAKIAHPAIDHGGAIEVAVCLAAGLVIAVWAEQRRKAEKES